MKVVCFGDSTTAGTPAFRSPVEAPPNGFGNEQHQYAYWLKRRHPEWLVLNRGVGGERTDEILARFDRDVLAAKPQVVIVMAGVNDLYQGEPAAAVEKNLQAIYDRAAQAKIKVMACTVLPYNGAPSGVKKEMVSVNRWIREASEKQGLGFCDTHAAVEDPARPGNLADTADGWHPDVEGHKKLAAALADALEKWLR